MHGGAVEIVRVDLLRRRDHSDVVFDRGWHCQIAAADLFILPFEFVAFEKVGAIEQSHGIDVHGDVVRCAIDLRANLEHRVVVVREADGAGAVRQPWSEVFHPAGASKFVDPIEIDFQEVVGAIAFAGRKLGDQLVVHDRVDDLFELDLDTGQFFEFREHLFDERCFTQVFHQRVECRALEVARKTWGCVLSAGPPRGDSGQSKTKAGCPTYLQQAPSIDPTIWSNHCVLLSESLPRTRARGVI